MYCCKRCGYDSKLKQSLVRHLQRLKECPPIYESSERSELLKELQVPDKVLNNDCWYCRHCNQGFNNKSNMYRHAKVCKSNLANEQNDQIRYLRTELDNLKTKIDNTKPTSSTVNNNTQNVHVIQNINIQVREFGFENMSHLPQDFLNYCFANKKIVDLIDNIHFDKECPENHNVRLRSKKQELMEVFENGKWIVKDQDQTLMELIEKGYRILYRHGKINKNEIMEEEDVDDEEFREINKWLEKIYDDQKAQKPLKRDLIIRFINNQAILLGR